METLEKDAYSRLKQIMLVESGIVLSLFVAAATGETSGYIFEMPSGWFALLFLTTLLSFPIGLALLWDRANPGQPIETRRDMALGYLMLTFVNALSFAVHMLHSSKAGFALFCPGVLGLLILVVYLRLYQPFALGEDLFP